MSTADIAQQIADLKEKVVLIYAFNATGKTRLSVAYKDATKNEDGTHTGIYFNAFSEDLFVWNNDIENDEENIRLVIKESNLNLFHNLLSECSIQDKLKPYRPKFDFRFNLFQDAERGIESISFYPTSLQNEEHNQPIKISRGEERIFVWCFFLALFEVEGWADKRPGHFFIDDPVSSLDDHNIFVTASTLCELIEEHFERRKIILTTHHIGLFSILADWLTKSENKEKYKKKHSILILSTKRGEGPTLEKPTRDVFLYHLRILQMLEQARQSNNVTAYHFALLRQALENISSFLGSGQFSHVLREIGIEDDSEIARIINTLSHKKVYYYESDQLVPDNIRIFNEIMTKLQEKYNFVLHEAIS